MTDFAIFLNALSLVKIVRQYLERPGGDSVIGALNITGNFTQTAGGSIEIEIASNAGVAGTDYDL